MQSLQPAPGIPADKVAETFLRNPHAWGPGVEQRIPTALSPHALPVKANHGRWVVECPCGAAQMTGRTDPRFYCVECGNALFDGKWVSVEWPKNAAAIEQELDRRPLVSNRNWFPGETVAVLRDETKSNLARLAQQVKQLERKA
jgi:hypothetical protein